MPAGKLKLEALEMSDSFWDKVQKRAYFNYLNRKNSNMPEDSYQDWIDAMDDEIIDSKIAEDAYYHYIKGSTDPVSNWEIAKGEIMDRIRFLAFYLHVSDINKSPVENWVNAKKMYIIQF